MEKNCGQEASSRAVAAVVEDAAPNAARAIVRLEGTRIGDFEVPEDMVIEFPEGILGFPDSKRFVIVPHPSGGPFQWLQSVDEPELAFVAADPTEFFDNYQISLSPEQLRSVKATSMEEIIAIVFLVVPLDPKMITANLQGPVLINPNERLGQQFVLSSQGYSTRQPVFPGKTSESPSGQEVELVGPAPRSGRQ